MHGLIQPIIIQWKEKANLFSFSDSRKICIAYERKTPDSISVSTKPSKVNYQTGERFNPDGLVVTASYPGDINDEIPCDSFRKYLFSFDPTTDIDLSNANDKVTITCCGASVDLPIYVEPVVDSISMNKTPNYGTYSVGEKLDVDGLSINVDYVGAASREVVYNNETKSAFSFDPNLNYTYAATDIGVKIYTLTYRGKQTTFDINVLDNNKFVVHSVESGNIHSEVLEVGDSRIESVLDAAIHDNFTGFYKIDASGYSDSQKKYDNTTIQTMTRAQILELFNAFTGTENIFIGAAVKAPAPPAPPKPPRPYNPGGGGGSSGGGGGGSAISPMDNLAKNPLEQCTTSHNFIKISS